MEILHFPENPLFYTENSRASSVHHWAKSIYTATPPISYEHSSAHIIVCTYQLHITQTLYFDQLIAPKHYQVFNSIVQVPLMGLAQWQRTICTLQFLPPENSKTGLLLTNRMVHLAIKNAWDCVPCTTSYCTSYDFS